VLNKQLAPLQLHARVRQKSAVDRVAGDVPSFIACPYSFIACPYHGEIAKLSSASVGLFCAMRLSTRCNLFCKSWRQR
jgi:hypothetical protein